MRKFIPDVFIIFGAWLTFGSFIANTLDSCSSSYPHNCSITAANIGLFFMLVGVDMLVRKFIRVKQSQK